MWKRNWQESLETISQTGEGTYAYFSLFAASQSLPLPPNPVSTLVFSAPWVPWEGDSQGKFEFGQWDTQSGY